MYTNRVNTYGYPTNEIETGNYTKTSGYDVIFCPHCGAMNYIYSDWCGSIKGLTFCNICGQEI